MRVLGIEIATHGTKGAPVDLVRGTLAAQRCRVPTPDPATPEAVADVVRDVVAHFGWTGAVGCTFPGRVKNGVVVEAVGLDERWLGTDAAELFTRRAETRVRIVKEADAVGLAEHRFGAARHAAGVVVVVSFGDAIGSAVLVDGHLVPGTELARIEVRGRTVERRVSGRLRDGKALGFKQWTTRIDEFLVQLENLLGPDLFVLGGTAAKQADRMLPRLTVTTPVVPGLLLGAAGMVGAALAAAEGAGPDRGRPPPVPDPSRPAMPRPRHGLEAMRTFRDRPR